MSVGNSLLQRGAVPQTLAQDATEERQTEVSEALARLSRVIDHIGMTANSLCDRLRPVRRQTDNIAGKGEPQVSEPVLCWMADSIRSKCKEVDAINAGLLAALNELEI